MKWTSRHVIHVARVMAVAGAVASTSIISVAARAANGPDADSIVRVVEKNLGPDNFHSTFQFINHRTDGTTTEYEVQFQTRDADHSHGSFIRPEREKGREVLRLDDEIWTFVPGSARIVRIADRDSFAGGDFSNADVMRVDWLKKYKAMILKDLPNQWIIEMAAKTSEAPYAKMRIWVDKKSNQPVQQHFYDSKGTLIKKCLYGEVKTWGSITRPARLEMENVITRQKSELKVLDIKLVGKIPDSRFVVNNLGK